MDWKEGSRRRVLGRRTYLLLLKHLNRKRTSSEYKPAFVDLRSSTVDVISIIVSRECQHAYAQEQDRRYTRRKGFTLAFRFRNRGARRKTEVNVDDVDVGLTCIQAQLQNLEHPR